MLTAAFKTALMESLRPYQESFRQLQGKRVLITGANGLIPGTLLASLALADRFLGIPVQVTAICNRHQANVDALLAAGYENIKVLKANLAEGVPSELAEHGFDYIVHGASLASPAKYLANRIDTIKVNVMATMRLLEQAHTTGATNFLYISSGEIYGSPDAAHVPTPEDYMPQVNHLTDRACYGEAKRFAESVCHQFHLETGQTVCAVRPVHVFGPGLQVNDGRVIADFLANALAGKPVVVKSDGRDRRAFCYSLDANLMLLHVLLGHRRGFDVFNIGNPDNDVSIAELAHMVGGIGGTTVEIQGKKPASAMETPAHSAPDINKLSRTFGIGPTIGLHEGLTRTLEWMRDNQPLH